MTLLVQLAAQGLWTVTLMLFAAQLVAREAGAWLGLRAAKRSEQPLEGVGLVTGAILALLAFVLALTLSFASARFDERRTTVLGEADAIDGAWRRAVALGHPRADAMVGLLPDYTRLRIAYVQSPPDPVAIRSILHRSDEMAATLWGHAAALVRERPDAAVTGMVNALATALGAAASVRSAYEYTLPPQLFWLLIGMVLMGMGVLGYQLGLRRRCLRILTTLLIAVWTLVVIDILDLGSPRLGSIKVDPAPYLWVLDDMAAGIPIPPLPR